MEKSREHYGLLTATTMIIGIVIGSGIFFKSDNILEETNGSVGLGVLVLCIGAFSIIFGSLTLTEISTRTVNSGGVVGYYEEFISKKIACGFGWFQTFVYMPAINAVVSWVVGIYSCTLFGIESTLMNQVLIGFVVLVVIYATNILSLKLGGYFQNATTIIKMIPLLGIAIAGIFAGSSDPTVSAEVLTTSTGNGGLEWLAALAPIAFSYDGWIIATSITNEVKNPKKNMPIALTIGPIVILGIYVLYFLGLTKMLGPEFVMSAGDSAVNKAGEILFGSNGTKILLVFIIISILGVVNGITLGSLRMPQALASKNMIPGSLKIAKINPKIDLSLGSCLVSFIFSIIWLAIHYFTQKSGLIGGGDVSEISIVFSYFCYIILYVKVILMRKNKIVTSFFKGIVCPILGILGSSIILIGSIISNPSYVIRFILFCFTICSLGFIYYSFHERQK